MSRPTLRGLLTLLAVLAGLATRAPAAPPIPEPLRPWVDWVLHGHEEARCPFLHGGEQRQCAWPSRLALDLDDRGGRFTQRWLVHRDGWLPLPGDARLWPQDVRIDGQPAVVTPQDGVPHIHLEAGTHTVMPLLVYRLAMLAWALWLAQALLRWLRWGWEAFTAGGMWRSLRGRPPAPEPQPAGR